MRKDYYIAIGAIIKNEGNYIEEWIEYHKYIGVERFYLVDNGSTDDTKEILKKYVDDGIVEYSFDDGTQLQLRVYNQIIEHHRKDTQWIAFIDVDEFIYLEGKESIKEFLKEYEDNNAIGVNWICVGPTSIRNKPEGFVIDNYTEALSLDCLKNLHIKSIVQTDKTIGFSVNPHAARYYDGNPAVDENHNLINGNECIYSGEMKYAFSDTNSTNKIAIIHYNTKSIEEYYYRSMKGKAWGHYEGYTVFKNGLCEYKTNKLFYFDKMKKHVHVLRELAECKNQVEGKEYEIIEGISYDSEEMDIIQKTIFVLLNYHKSILNGDIKVKICEQCQMIAMDIGQYLESIIGENNFAIKLLELYCEELYVVSEKEEVNSKNIECLNEYVLKMGFCIINI